MTGFGRAAADVSGARLAVEVRSVNHRGLDLKLRSADGDGYCDGEITRAVRAAVERGVVTVTVREERAASAPPLDLPQIREAQQLLDRIRREAGLLHPVDMATVAAFLAGGARAGGSDLRGEALWEALAPAVDAALAGLLATRAREGEALAADLGGRARRLQEIAAAVATAAAAVPSRFARRLEEKLAALRDAPGFDPGRVAQEVALLADRLDVSEELVRLGAHLDHFGHLLAAAGAVGRKLDFVIQEIGRELNTIASKAQDAGIAALIIDAKAELEKMREQAQNIE